MWVRQYASTLWVVIHMRLDRKNTKRTEILKDFQIDL
jgi:hypothetical protein